MIMPYYTEEQIKQARLIDLMTYLQTYEPTELVHVRGNTWCLREHMDILTDDSKDFQFETPRIFNRDNSSTERKLLLPEKCETNLEVIRYLSSRGIDREIIKDCINEGLLYESLPYHNCIFVGYDEAGKAAYA